MWEYEIKDGGGKRVVGELFVERCGLYYEFRAQTELSSGLRRLVVRDARGNPLRLGTPIPSGGKLRLSRRFSATELLWDGFSPESGLFAELLPSDVTGKDSLFLPFTACSWLPLKSLVVRRTENFLELREELRPKLPLLLNPCFSQVAVERDGGRILLVLRLGNPPHP